MRTQTASIFFSRISILCFRHAYVARCRTLKMVCGDTMNYWIADHAANLAKVLRDLDVLLINDGGCGCLPGAQPCSWCGEKVLSMGPKTLVVKHGEYGATAFFSDRSFQQREDLASVSPLRDLPLAGSLILQAQEIRLPGDFTGTWRHSLN